MKSCDLLVKFLREEIDFANLISVLLGPEGNLGEGLVGEGV